MTQTLPDTDGLLAADLPDPTARAPRPVGTVLVTGAASGLGRAVAAAVTTPRSPPFDSATRATTASAARVSDRSTRSK